MKNQLLLLEDVEGVGRSGDIVTVKPGFARNYLLPGKKAIIAEKHLVRLQERLIEERKKKAVIEKKESETIAKQLEGFVLKVQVKLDAEGHMYGSVSSQDVVNLLKDQTQIQLEKRNIVLQKPIKKIGVQEIELKLKEGVPAKILIEVIPEEKKGE